MTALGVGTNPKPFIQNRVIGQQDIEILIQVSLTPSKQRLTQIFGSLNVTTKYIDNLLKPMHVIAEINVKVSVELGA